MADRLSVKDFAGRIKAKYPTYSEIEDRELVSKIIAKYPEYEESIDFADWGRYGVVNAANKINNQNNRPIQEEYAPAPLQESIPKTSDKIPSFKPYQEQTPFTKQDAERLKMRDLNYKNPIPEDKVQIDLNPYDNKKYDITDKNANIADYNRTSLGEIAVTEFQKNPESLAQYSINSSLEEIRNAEQLHNDVLRAKNKREINIWGDASQDFGNGVTYDSQADKETADNYYQTRRLLEESNKILNQPEKSKEKGLFRGITDRITDVNYWKGAIGTLTDNANSKRILDKLNSGTAYEDLEESERAVLDAMATRTHVELLRKENQSNWYNAGKGITDMAPFIVDLAITGGLGKTILSTGEKKMLELVAKKLTGQMAKHTTQFGVKAASRLGMAGIAAAVTPGTVAGTLENMQGTVIGDIGEDYKLRYTGTQEKQALIPAALTAHRDMAKEYATEMSGGSLGVLAKYVKAIPGIDKVLGKLGSTTVGRMGKTITSNKYAQWMKANPTLKALYKDSPLGEWNEEWDGAIADHIWGVQDIRESFLTWDGQATLALTLAPMAVLGVGMNAASGRGIVNDYRKSNKNFADALIRNGYDLTDVPEIKRMLTIASPENAGKQLQQIFGKTDKDGEYILDSDGKIQFNENDYKEGIKFLFDSVRYDTYQGATNPEMLSREERQNMIDVAKTSGEQMFAKMQKEPNNGSMFTLNKKVDEMENALGEEFAFMTMDEVVGYMEDNNIEGDKVKQIEDYLVQRSLLYGAVEAATNQSKSEIAQIHSEIGATTRKDGTRLIVQTAEVNNQPGQTFYVTDGNIALDKQGNVIRTDSDTTLTVRDDSGETHILPINSIGKASYQNAQDAKNKIAEDISARYEDMLVKELDTNPIEVKKQDGSEITWYENGQPKQGIVIDKANGYVRIQEGNKVILKNEQELNEQLKNPTEPFHINDTMQLYIDGVAYDAEITSEKDADGRYTVNIPNHPEMINHELTTEELTAMQTAPVETETTPVADETAPVDEQTAPVQIDNMSEGEGENATIPTGETKQNVREYPKNKKGEIDFDNFTARNRFDYNQEKKGTQIAITRLSTEIDEVDKEIAALKKKVNSTVGNAQIKHELALEQKEDERKMLTEIINEVKPGFDAEKKAEAEKKAKIQADIDAKNKAVQEERKNKVLTPEEKTNYHNDLVKALKDYAAIPPAHVKIKQTKAREILDKATRLGYTYNNIQGNYVVYDTNGKEIRTIANKTPKEEIEAHPLINEYAPEFQAFAERLMLSAPETLLMPNANVAVGVKDIQAGKKSIASNRMLDEMEKMFNADEIIIRRTAFSPEVVMTVEDYFAMFVPQEIDNEIEVLNEMLQYAPQEFYFEIYDDLITDENIDYINQLFEQYGYEQQEERETRTYSGDEGTSSQEVIAGTQEEGISEEQESEPVKPIQGSNVRPEEQLRREQEAKVKEQAKETPQIKDAKEIVNYGTTMGEAYDNIVINIIPNLQNIAKEKSREIAIAKNIQWIDLTEQDYLSIPEYVETKRLMKLLDRVFQPETMDETTLDNLNYWIEVSQRKKRKRPVAEVEQQPEAVKPELNTSINYKNGDTVTYKGKQYEINAVGKTEDGSVIYDLEQDGKTVFEDVAESEMSTEPVTSSNQSEQPLEKPKGITVINEEDNGKTLIYGTKTNQTRLSVKGYTADEIKDELDLEVSKQNRTLANLENDEKTLSKTPIGKDYEGLKKLISDNKKLIESAKVTIPWLEKKLKEAKDQPSPTQKQPWEMTAKERWDAERKRAIKSDGKAYVEKHMATLEEYKNGSHRQLVEKAISEGRTVPAEVLADYPELKKEEVKPIGIDNQIEDVLLGETDEQKKLVSEKVDNVKKNIDRIVSINGKKVYDISIDDKNNIWYNFKKTGINANQKYYYPLQYAKIEYQEEVKPEVKNEINPERLNDHVGLIEMRNHDLPEINNNPLIINLNAFVDKIRELDEDDTVDKMWIERGFTHIAKVSYPHSLGEQGNYTEFLYKNYPTAKDIYDDVLALYPEEIISLQGKQLPYGGYAISGLNENIINEIKKALDYIGGTKIYQPSTPEQPLKSIEQMAEEAVTKTEKSKPTDQLLKDAERELKVAKAKYDKAYNKYLDLKKKLEKDPAFGMGGQVDIYNNVSGADNLFGNDGQKQAVEAVQAAKKQADDLKQAVDELQAKADKLREAVTNKILKQQEVKFEEEVPEVKEEKQVAKEQIPSIKEQYESFDTRGYSFAIVNEKGIAASGSNPALAKYPLPIKAWLELSEKYNGKLYIAPTDSNDIKPFDNEQRIAGLTWQQIKDRQQGIDIPEKILPSIPKGAVEFPQYETKVPEKNKTNLEQPQGEYKYRLTRRPPSIGTHPTENMVDSPVQVTSDKGIKEWVLTYSQKLDPKEVAAFELTPVIDGTKYAGKKVQGIFGKYIYTVKEVTPDFVIMETTASDGRTTTKDMPIAQFVSGIDDGKYRLIEEAVTSEPTEAEQDEADQIERAEILDELTAGEIEQIDDFGEKIGGARKDMDITRTSREKVTMPAWRRKYYFAVPGNVMTLGEKVDTSKPFVVAYDIETSHHGRKSKSKKVVADIKGGRSTYTPKVFTSEQEAEDYIPVFEVIRQGFRVRKGTDNYYIYKISSTGKEMEFDNFKTEAEAIAYITSTEGSISLLNRKREDFSIPSLEKAERTGKDWRKGKNISTEELMSTFGIRGGEFGNWVKPEERRVFLNTTYDSFMDLAELLGISPKAISLGGNLAIAFGSRGSGGFDSAAAHYEPGRAVINMTRLNGTGALAHEWAHALDNYFGLQDRKQDYTKDKDGKLIHSWSNLTEGKSFKGGMRGELLDLFMKITDYTTSKQVTQLVGVEENQLIFDKIQVSVKNDADRLLLKLKNGVTRSKYNRKTKKYDEVVVKATEEQYSKVKELLDIIATATGGEIKWQALSANTLGDWAYLSDEIREIETIYKSVFGSTGLKRNGNGYYNLTYYANKLKEAKQKLDDAKSGKTETVKVATDYYTNSKQFDKQKATPYWATKVELFARSFEGYINTLLQEKGVKSDYLQYDKAPVYKAVWGISPYAEGEELASMNKMWKEFFNTIQEDDNGAMFQSVSPIGFYSTVEKALEAINQEKGSKDQFKAMLLKKGAKQAEMDWMGFDELPEKLTKSDIQNWIDENRIEVKEVEKGDYSNRNLEAVKVEPFVYNVVDTKNGEVVLSNVSQSRADEFIDNAHDGTNTKYSQYTLPGGPLSRDTEILSINGWVRMDKISVGDIVLSRKDEGGILEWVEVEAVPTVFEEKLYHFKSQSIDMMVTPYHQMVVEKRTGGATNRKRTIQRMTANELWNTWDCRIPLTGTWEGENSELIFGLNAGDVMEFMGWFISEGHSIKTKKGNKTTLAIGQSRLNNSIKHQRIEDLLNRLSFKYNYVDSAMSFNIGVTDMPKELVSMCHSIGTAKDKFIPNELFKYSKNLLERLFESLILGDGTTIIDNKNIRKVRKNYFTISKQLADDFQRLTLLIGYRAKIGIRYKNDNQINDLYSIGVNLKPYCTVDDAKYAIVDYNDTAYCVTVKNHAIYVRRNGIAAFTGNSNYKELLLTMPAIMPNKVSNLPNGWQLVKREGKPFAVYSEDGYLKGQGNSEEVAIENALRDLNISYKSGNINKKNFISSHFSEPNILAHVRFNERTVNGERVLFIEEIQSDWAQTGKKKGFKGDVDKKYEAYRIAKAIYDINRSPADIETKRKVLTALKSDAETKNISEQQIIDISNEYGDFTRPMITSSVPDMPFKKTDQWVNLAIRRIMRYAAQNGFDRLAWANGTQQAERYDLSKQIDHIAYKQKGIAASDNAQMYEIQVFDKSKNEVLSGSYRAEELEGVVGKEVAQKILNGEGNAPLPGKDLPTYLTGLDLKVGGEGMKAFYDAIVPSAMSKLGKPFGAKVENVDLSKDKDRLTNIAVENEADIDRLSNENYTLYVVGKGKLNAEKAKELFNEGWNVEVLSPSKSVQQSIPVTNSMKETALAGMPLFHRANAFTPTTSKKAKVLIKHLMKTGLVKDVRFVDEAFLDGLEGATTQRHSVYHGSPHEFDKFSLDKIGTGEGAQAYGWGLYFTDKKSIAEDYANTLARGNRYNPNLIYSVNGISFGEMFKTVKNPIIQYVLDYIPINSLNGYQLWQKRIDEAKANVLNENFHKMMHESLIAKLTQKQIEGAKLFVNSAVFSMDKTNKANLYTAELHEGKQPGEYNYLRWDKPFREQSQAAKDAFSKGFSINSFDEDYETVGDFYKARTRTKTPKQVSEELLALGIDGIQYPAEYTSKGTHEDAFNYVVFDDSAIEIVEHVQFMRTKGNVKYGAIKDGVVYLNENLLNSNTPIHEFGHAYIDFIEKNNQELFNRGAELVKETTYWKTVNKNKDYKNLSETARIKEAMAMAIGDNGESVVNDNGLKAKLKRWISDVWKRIGSAFGINNLTSEQISKLSFKDFVDIATSEVLSGENLTENELSNPLRRLDKAYEAKEYEGIKNISITKELAKHDIPVPTDVWKDSDTIFTPIRTVFNENNIAVSLYKQGTSRIRDVHKRGDALLYFQNREEGLPIIDKDYAEYFRDEINPEIDRYVEMLQRVKYLSTPAAQKIINELIEDARLSKDYYDRLAAGEDVWRTEKSPRFHIVGVKGAENLDKAEEATTRMDNLRVAKEMEAAIPENVIKDKYGKPVDFYHGTNVEINKFDKNKTSGTTAFGNGFSFIDTKGIADDYAYERAGGDEAKSIGKGKPTVIKANLVMDKPFDVTMPISINTPEAKKLIDILTSRYGLFDGYVKNMLSGGGKKSAFYELSTAIFDPAKDEKVFMFAGNPEKFRKILEEAGYDGVISEYEDAKEYFVFNPEQIARNFTPLEIRQATGWERGADGLWRYETGKHTIHHQLQDYLNKSADGFIKWINARHNHGLPVNLQDIFGREDETLKAYPQLRNMPVEIVSDADLNGAAGDYDPETKSIRINVKVKADQDKLFSILEHEVQHAIQEIEGFARGGNTAMFKDVKSIDNVGLFDIFDKIKKENPKTIDELKSLKNKILGDNPYMYEVNNWINTVRKIENGDVSIKDIVKTPREQYHNLAGEVEARNASTRKDYTDEQRRNTLLSETAEVAPEDQIIIMDGLGVSMSMTEDEVQAKADKIKNEGLKSVIPDYTKFLTDVYDTISDSSRKFIIDRAKNYGWDMGRATEEYLASFVKGVSPSELEQIAELAGLQDIAPSEIKMAFWDNFNKKDNSPEYIAKRSLAVNDSRDGVLPKHPTIKQVQEAYERILTPKRKYNKSNLLKKETGKHAAFRVEESYANSLASLRVFMDIIGEVPDKYNPYYLMQLYTSAASTTMDRYEKKEFKDMMEALTQLNKKLEKAEGLNYLSRDYKGEKGEINRGTLYALAKAGLDRNERLARKNAAEQLQPEYKKLSKQLLKGEIDQEAYEDMLSILSDKENELAEDINAKHDFGGLTGLAKLVGSDAENFEDIREVVDDIVAEAEGAVNTNDFWAKTKAATSYVLTYQYNRGMIAKELYDEILAMEPHYLPLRGYDEATAGDVYEYFTSFKGEFNPVLKKAKGHEHLPENPFAHIKSITASGVLQAEKNRAKQALLNLVENNKNDLVTAGKSWIRNIGTEEIPEWEDAYPVIPEDATPEQVTEAINDFENKMKELASEGKAAIKSKKLKLNLPIGKGVPEEHTIKVRRNGEERTMYVNGNPRLAQAINGMLNPDATDTGKVLKVVKAINRGMSANFTSRNLEFAITNTLRDLHMAIVLSGIEEGIGYSAKLAKNAVVAQRTLASHIFGSGTKGKYQEYLQEFLENGGQTGFVNLRSVERYHKDIKKLERELRKKDPFAIPKWIFGQIEDVNQMGELISRFATYITSREAGRSVTRSSVDAKNITLNFNQKGTGELGASWFQNLILFFNPAMQALYRANQAREKHPARFWGVMGAHAAAGAMVPMLTFIIAGMIGDDDDKKEMEDAYWNTSTWIRRNNLMIWIPKTKSFITIPLGQELRWAYSIGEIAFTKAMGKDAYGKNVGAEMVGAVTALLPVDMFGASHSYMPGFATPIYESSVNENFMGNPIYKSTPWNENDPSHTKAYSRTWKGFVNVSKKINELTGGDDVTKGKVDINPAVAQHLVEGYLGGLVSVYLRGADVAAAAMKGEEYTMNEVPFLRRVYKVSDKTMVDSSVKREYFNILNDLEKDYGHKELRWRQKNKEYELKYNNGIKSLQDNGVELTPETTAGILTPEELKDWQEYQEKYNDLIQTTDARKMQIFKDAKKTRDKWEKDGEEFSDTYLMQQVLEKVKAIDEAEETNY